MPQMQEDAGSDQRDPADPGKDKVDKLAQAGGIPSESGLSGQLLPGLMVI